MNRTMNVLTEWAPAGWVCVALALAVAHPARGDEATESAALNDPVATPPVDEANHLRQAEPPPRPRLPEPVHAKRLTKPDRVWVDVKRREVLVDGYVSLERGVLEMFACSVGTKEHESVLALETRAQIVHTALLAVGAKPGSPAQFHPKFKPPSGTEIELEVRWLDLEGENKGNWNSARAQQWVRDIETKKIMTEPWVFAGSGFWVNPETGKRHYMAEAGDMICVSNFTTAMLDIPIESSDSDEGRLFEANSDKVPPLGTPVRLILRPKLKGENSRESQKPRPTKDSTN